MGAYGQILGGFYPPQALMMIVAVVLLFRGLVYDGGWRGVTFRTL